MQTTPRKWRFKPKDTVLNRMASAVGDGAYHADGTPKVEILLGTNRSGTGSNFKAGRGASSDTIATVGMRLALLDPSVGDVFDALRELVDVIEITGGDEAAA